MKFFSLLLLFLCELVSTKAFSLSSPGIVHLHVLCDELHVSEGTGSAVMLGTNNFLLIRIITLMIPFFFFFSLTASPSLMNLQLV